MTDTMRAWRVHDYGPPLESLQLDTVPVPTPEADELLVRVQAIPLNLNDLERITGGNMMVRPELPYAPGMEVMGVVESGGPGAEDWAGRRVVALPKQAIGGYAEFAVCPTVSAFEVPESIALPDAAAIYFPFHLAWLGLFDRAGLQAGESVLIHAAAGGSGSAAIQLAKHAGAKVIATAGGQAKTDLCRQLGADVVVDYTDPGSDFVKVVEAETGGKGVEVVFDNVGESVFEQSLACTAYNGRYLMMGFASNKVVVDEPWIVPRRIALGNLHLCGVLLAYGDEATTGFIKSAMGWNFTPAATGARIMREIVGLVEHGAVRPVIGEVVGFDDVPRAIDALANRATIGRTVVRLW